MSKNVKVDGVTYSGVSQVKLQTADGGTAMFKDVDEIATPSGSVTITENGTHNVANYAQAVVNVQSGGSDGDGDLQNMLNILLQGKGVGTAQIDFVIPDGIIAIRNNAFYGMQNLDVKMADSVESIGSSAFAYGDGLTVDKLPNNLETIGATAFQYCKLSIDASELVIPAGVTVIDRMAFNACSAPNVATFKGTPTSIASEAFYSSSIKTVNVPWAEGAVANAPWGATTVNYNYTGA